MLTICQLTDDERETVENRLRRMSEQGLRVIAVAITKLHSKSDIPATITDCNLTLNGLVGLTDPPRESVKLFVIKRGSGLS